MPRMNIHTALITISDQKYGTNYVYLGVGGQPHAFVNTLMNALGGRRTSLSSRKLALFILASIGLKRLESCNFYHETEVDRAFAEYHDFRYEIELYPKSPTKMRVVRVSENGTETPEFQGLLEGFINHQRRQLRNPRGRTPKGYANRTEYLEAINSRRLEKAPHRAGLMAAVMQSRQAKPPMTPDLRGVTEYTKEEYLERRRARRLKK